LDEQKHIYQREIQTLFSGDALEMKTSSQRQGTAPHPTAAAAMEMCM